MKKIKTALVGYGSVGEKIHAPLITSCNDLELVAVVERNGRKSKEDYPQIELFKSLDSLLKADVADLIVIVTPNHLHFDQAKLVLSYGKHLVIDKPVTIMSAEAEELKTIAIQKELLISVFQNRRFDGDFQTIQKILQEGILGRLVHFESHFDRFRPTITENWREKEVPGNGITYDLGTHLIDQAYILFGMPKWVSADIRIQRAHAIADDFFDITLGYDSIFVRLTASVLSNAPMPKFLLMGEKGSFSKYGLDVQERAFKAKKMPQGADWGLEKEESWGTIYLEDQNFKYETLRGDYRLFYENIAKSIQGIETPHVKIDEAIAVLQIIEAAFESNKKGKKVST